MPFARKNRPDSPSKWAHVSYFCTGVPFDVLTRNLYRGKCTPLNVCSEPHSCCCAFTSCTVVFLLGMMHEATAMLNPCGVNRKKHLLPILAKIPSPCLKLADSTLTMMMFRNFSSVAASDETFAPTALAAASLAGPLALASNTSLIGFASSNDESS